MMNTMTNNKLNMEELEIVNGGGFFDFISDVVDIAADFTVDVLKQLNG